MLARIFIILPIFVANTEDLVVPSVAAISNRVRRTVNCSPIGVLSVVARNILRPQDI